MKLVIVGHGGHSKVVHDLIISENRFEIIGYLDEKYKEISLVDNIYFGPVHSAKDMLLKFINIKFIVAIGDNKVRKQVIEKLNLQDEYFTTLIHKTAWISPSSKIGNGTVVMPNVVINADSKIGNHTIINTGAIIEHDSIIGNFSHVSPGAVLTGAVQIEECVHIGAGATIIPSIKIGKCSVIGAGATVINHVPSDCTAVGVPAIVKKINKTGGENIAKYNI
ncbi:acetyltransferase [Bacillus sp. ISL-18]|uniref:acetyltransferase n=1 Tax=Bacillus sp. ISL-18 TaxID=2819118 RepID=UPI001BE9A869|nr:acetyltransferase [Bacillus sp. ISL-18]MBT2657094.1 acetyltransferase [Bacillus sp. ISL-18]